jgi:hypothetical protein
LVSDITDLKYAQYLRRIIYGNSPRRNPSVNALTTPQSYTLRYLPRNVVGYDELAEEIAKENPNYNEALVKAIMVALNQKIQENLIDGNQVTLENAFTYRLSFTAKLNEIDEPLPKKDELIQVKISPSHPFVAEVRNSVKLEKLPPSEKLPLIASTEDTRLKSVAGVGGADPIEVGILTGKASSPYVTITGGALTANEMLRIQVILKLSEGHLLFNLLDMTENGGKAGDVVKVTGDSAYTLTGFADSALTRLDIKVNNFNQLVKMIRSSYSGRLVDILDMKA